MRRRSHLFLFPLISILFLSAFSYGQAWSGILAPGRAIDWSNAGIPGGIPSGSWTQCGSAIASGASASTINSALASCPANHYVLLGPGNFSGTIYANKNNVVLRGSGPTQTTLTGTILMGNGSSGQGSTPGGMGSTSLNTLAQGSTVLTVGSTTGMSAGQIVAVYEANPSYVNPAGNEGNENATWCPSPSLNFFGCSTRSQAEMVQITNVNSGTQITISPGLSKTYSAGSTPAVVYWSTSGVYSYGGVENMKVNANKNNFAVSFVFCNFCWAKNLAVINIARAGMYSFFGFRDELRDSYISASNTTGAPTEYGVEIDRSSLTKLENNIFFGVTTPLVMESENATVVGYNYTLNTATDNVYPTLDEHRAHAWMNLLEGNVTSKIQLDNVWGSGSHDTTFRTYARGTDPNKHNYRTAIDLDAYHRFNNIVANVLGDPTVSTHYECDQANQTGVDLNIYDLGGYNGCGTTPYDTTTESSLMRWGNWDAITYIANGSTNGVRYCTGSGAGNAACTGSETASADPTFPGLSSPSSTFPASFYNGATTAHSSCGTGLSFWKNPNNGFCPQYPPIGPDVACTTNCISNTATHAAMIPAQLCYSNAAKDNNGFLTSFDANACYANDPASTSNVVPPTGLSASVQ
jgi:hypothetical protein